jgi:glucan 1,3-beta-glucosidase
VAGDGSTDDTAAINSAISSGNRCGNGCDSSTVTPAIVYFPAGTYIVSRPIVQYYYTQFIGNPQNLPVIKAAANFQGIAVLDTDPYIPGGGGAQWYTNQNNFFRQIRNFVVDITAMPISSGAGIHWQVAQATSLQNIRFEMIKGGGSNNKQQGIFMDNGSGGFMTDLVFNGGLFGAFFGNQQFTTRNLTFNDCQTAIYMNWNWLWTLKSVSINNCQIGIDMSNNPVDQTVGSVLLLDSKFTNTPTAIKTAFSSNSKPETGGTLVIDNVDFSGSQKAVVDVNGRTVLAGGAVVSSWAQGSIYRPSEEQRPMAKRQPQAPASHGCSGSPEIAALSDQSGGTLPEIPATSLSPSNVGLTDDSTSIHSAVGTGVPSNALSSGSTDVGSSSSSPTLSMGDSSTVPSSGTALPSPTSVGPFGNGTQSNVTDQSCSTPASPKYRTRAQQVLTAPTKPRSLLKDGKVFERSKPQYENVPVSAFVSVKSRGAIGDGVTDDTAAIQKILNSAGKDQIVYFDHGAYVITDTVIVPKDIKITGEIWPLIMASGPAFADRARPKPVFRVGSPGDRGAVEMSDLMFQTLGPAPGAILMEWNVADSSQGACALWDVHFRIGGTAGTKLQIDRCRKNENITAPFKPECVGAFMLMHITREATAYLENTWFWVADHELDLSTWPGYRDNNQINIYNGRGILVESKGPVWMYGTSSEHHQLYNYQISNARAVWMGSIQTETAYMQANPNALEGGFTPNPAYGDPTFSSCRTALCKKTWGLRILDSEDVYLYGGGLYSFFENYKQQCLDTESCQENMIDIQCSKHVWLYGVSTKASVNMVTVNGQSQAKGLDNDNNFCQTLALFENP